MNRATMWRAVLGLGFLAAVAIQLPAMIDDARAVWPVAKLWEHPDEQYRAVLGSVPYDLLVAADARLPRDARVMLVTPGADVRIREYTTFHRALYFLTPRPIHWITPAPGDGTYEARSWTTASLSSESICSEAARFGATDLLFVDVQPPVEGCPGMGWGVVPLPGGTLVAIAGDARTIAAPPPAWATSPIGLLPALAIPVAIGMALLSFVLRAGELHRAQRLALTWAVGSGLVALIEGGLSVLGVPPAERRALLVVLSVLASILVVGRWARSRRVHPMKIGRPSVEPVSAVLSIAIVAEVALVGLIALGRPLSIWDGWANWAIKARAMFIEGHISAAVYADPTRASTHLGYPPNLPLLESWLFGWLGAPDDRLLGVVGVVTYAALLGFVYGSLRHWRAARRGALAATVLLGSIVFVWRTAAAGFADVPLALLITIATVLMVEYLRVGSRGVALLGAISAGLMAGTKLEGLVVLIVLILASVVAAVIGRGDRTRARAITIGAAYLTGGVLLSGAWWMFVTLNGFGSGEYVFTFDAIAAGIGRIGTIVKMEVVRFLVPDWSYVWLVAALIGLASLFALGGTRRRVDRPSAGRVGWILPLTAGLSLLVLGSSYVVTTYAPFTAQIEASAFRLMLQVLPITMIWAALHVLPLAAHRPAREPTPL